MRLSPAELSAIRKSLEGVDCRRVFLFGSRTDDSARGGDIDLLVYSAAPAFELASRVSSRFAREHDARLDVLVIDPSCLTAEQQAFISTLTLEPLDDIL
ncbi:MAG: nucleotidyltransferase domain-containing protein [Betaproteobacteria bacterium]|uniref:Nucleotidyltransferase domain-containing protein n=1 Tax=Candidatus Proximibacter danicus TaxID=2954365 RepID=A0A9D7K327_9PROT|nr:nucleotidyltransferase domain-containing protein [Candidatus Proximibacter danicus]